MDPRDHLRKELINRAALEPAQPARSIFPEAPGESTTFKTYRKFRGGRRFACLWCRRALY